VSLYFPLQKAFTFQFHFSFTPSAPIFCYFYLLIALILHRCLRNPRCCSPLLPRLKLFVTFECTDSTQVPEDPTVLLTIAGMLQFKPVFMGEVRLHASSAEGWRQAVGDSVTPACVKKTYLHSSLSFSSSSLSPTVWS